MALALGGLLASGCAGPLTQSTESPSSTPARALGPAASIGCGEDVNLVGPDGREVNLTGLWTVPESDRAIWNIRQVGNCFFLVYRHPPDEEDPEYSDQICDGRIGADFVITGRCVEFIHRSGPVAFGAQAYLGVQVFLITFDSNYEPQLQKCPPIRSLGSCDEPMIRFDTDAES